ncbi:MAG: response regulator [Verrucomicrobiota bacterium]|nr:response regulator [Limisphaera sp.]MDW8381626.1 response regulator [Verrucomicrobiota bacterium]
MNRTLRILFVDDEPMILDGLRRSLRFLRSEWTLAFATSGPEALTRMEMEPFDVIVTDMRMPGMSGVELLRIVRQRHPEVARLVLSGQADEKQVLQCVGLAHQYLAKPCDPESLRSAIHRVVMAGTCLNNPRLRELLGRLDRLPSFPRVYMELNRTLENPEVNLSDVADLVRQDLAMTAKILQLVNSAFFGLAHVVTDIEEAVNYLGINTLKTLVLAVHAFAQYEEVQLPWFPYEGLWRHSLQAASHARWVAEMENVGETVQEQAAIAGLLHDIGQLILAANLQEEYKNIREQAAQAGVALDQIEKVLLGTTHAETGGYLLGLWGLPEPMVEAIALHHHPGLSGSTTFTPLTAVHVAETLQVPGAEQPDGPLAGPDESYLQRLGLLDRREAWWHRLNRIEPR